MPVVRVPNDKSWTALVQEIAETSGRGDLAVLLAVLLGWWIFSGLGNLHLWLLLAIGVVLGWLYPVSGRLPVRFIDRMGGSITGDDDPSNISPRVYLPILFALVLVAVVVFFAVFFGL